MPDKVRKWRDETIKMVEEAIEQYRLIACKPSDLRAYGKDKAILPAELWAVEKMRKAGYLYEPLSEGTVVLIIQPKKEVKKSAT